VILLHNPPGKGRDMPLQLVGIVAAHIEIVANKVGVDGKAGILQAAGPKALDGCSQDPSQP
jgi:hypothetical protein